MKVCLVICPGPVPEIIPLSIPSLCSYLKDKSHDVCVLDLGGDIYHKVGSDIKKLWRHRWWGCWNDEVSLSGFINSHGELLEGYVERILNSGARVIGFSVWASSRGVSLYLARRLKELDGERIIVFGGPGCHPEFFRNGFIRNNAVDMVVYGEGEEAFAEILELYEKYGRVERCPGTLLKNGDEIIDCGPRREIANLDGLPFPDFSDFDLSKYEFSNTLPIIFSRGCVKKCTFCSIPSHWKEYRYRTAENIYEEIKHQVRRHPGINDFRVCGTAINSTMSELLRLCDFFIRDGLRITWWGNAAIREDMTADVLNKMRKAGCTKLMYGVKSGSRKVVNLMGMGFDMLDAERVIRATHKTGIQVWCSFMCGFPGETEDDFKETLEFISKNRGYISRVFLGFECRISSGTYLYDHPEEFDVIPGDDMFSWRTGDGRNTPEGRARRRKLLSDFVESLDFVASSEKPDWKTKLGNPKNGWKE